MSRTNKKAWENKAYAAWVRAYGTPEELAKDLQEQPRHYLRYWLKYIGNPAGQRILNLLGSHGRKAIPLALLGADVTVVDLSRENRRYALETAAAAGVSLNYLCADVLNIPEEDSLGKFDIVLMEFGVLHYFYDLSPLFALIQRRLHHHGRLLLTDFHPYARTWMNSRNLTNPTGNYFYEGLKQGEVAYAKLLSEDERSDLPEVLVKSWTMGDILTAAANHGLYLRTLEELPSSVDPGKPEFYTLVADKVELALPPLFPDQ